MRPGTSSLPTHFPAQPLGGAAVRLAVEASLARGARRLGRPARLRRNERTADEIRQSLQGFAPILLLGAVISRNDEDRAIIGEPAPRQHAQPALHLLRKRGAAAKVETQLHGRGHLVHVLTAG